MPYIIHNRVYEHSKLILYRIGNGEYLVLWEVQRDRLRYIRREVLPLRKAWSLLTELAAHIEQYEKEKAQIVFERLPHNHKRVPQWSLQPEHIRNAIRKIAWRTP